LIHYLIINWTHCDSQNDLLNIGSIFSVTPNQIERLYSRFTSLDRGNSGTLSREDLLRIPELAINPLGDRIVHAFFQEGTGDSINFLQFMQVLAHFRPIKKNKDTKLNSREQKLKCNFFSNC
jgi:calcineurin B homologous protein 1